MRALHWLGSGAGDSGHHLSTCHGRGEVLYQQSFLSIRRTCSTCNGAGQIIRTPCSQCRGQGYRQVHRKLKVTIPAGVDESTRIRLANEGQPGANGGPAGDLYVFLKVREHAFFERREQDLHCTIPVNLAQAVLGAEIEVPTLDQPYKVKIPRGYAERWADSNPSPRRPGSERERSRRSVCAHRSQDSHAIDARAAETVRATARDAACR
ncbi:MAG: DnaJ C-terminal domain-containing protein [Ignavibacteriota bacterium]